MFFFRLYFQLDCVKKCRFYFQLDCVKICRLKRVLRKVLLVPSRGIYFLIGLIVFRFSDISECYKMSDSHLLYPCCDYTFNWIVFEFSDNNECYERSDSCPSCFYVFNWIMFKFADINECLQEVLTPIYCIHLATIFSIKLCSNF